jgi:DNA polymerase-3 subunit epsilon
MVATAPSIETVMPGFAEFVASSVLVAHDTAFDVAVLDRAARRVLGRPLGLPVLCTLKLVRRLFPELTKASLDALARHFGLVSGDRHRAIADAELTAGVLTHVLRVAVSRGCRTVGELVDLERGDEAHRPERIRVSRRSLERAPESPGVFWLLDREGRTLYVAEADNVREQIVAQVTGATAAGGRRRAMVREIADVGFVPTGSALDSAIVFAHETAARQPSYNRPGRHLPRGSFVKIGRRGRFPRITVASRVVADGAGYLGPIKDAGLARAAAELFARLYGLRTCPGRLEPDPQVEPCERGPAGWCSSPCNASVDQRAYGERVEALLRDLGSGGRGLRDRLESTATDSTARQDRACLGRLLKLHRDRHWLVDRHDYLIAVPAAGGGLRLLLVLGGNCCFVGTVVNRDDLAQTVCELGSTISPKGKLVSSPHADLSTVLAHWVRRRDAAADRILIDLSRDEWEVSIATATAVLERHLPIVTPDRE